MNLSEFITELQKLDLNKFMRFNLEFKLKEGWICYIDYTIDDYKYNAEIGVSDKKVYYIKKKGTCDYSINQEIISSELESLLNSIKYQINKDNERT